MFVVCCMRLLKSYQPLRDIPGITCPTQLSTCLLCVAGTGLRDAVQLLEAMLNDSTDFVRQGASIAMALVLIQQPESVVEPFRKKVRNTDAWVISLVASVMSVTVLFRVQQQQQPGRGLHTPNTFFTLSQLFVTQQAAGAVNVHLRQI